MKSLALTTIRKLIIFNTKSILVPNFKTWLYKIVNIIGQNFWSRLYINFH